MILISELPHLALGCFAAWMIFLFWGNLRLLIVGFREKRRMNLALRNTLHILCTLADYLLFQLVIAYTSGMVSTEPVKRLVAWFVGLPAVVLLLVGIPLTVAELLCLASMRSFRRTHITAASLKDAIDTLPVGICTYEESGKVTLKNYMMEDVCRRLTGVPLLNGIELAETLKSRGSDLGSTTVEIPGRGVWRFEREVLQDKNDTLTLILAYNVTEAYEKTRMLDENRRKVETLNVRLMEYNKRIEAAITAQEVLNAKIRIHDELGAELLTIRRCLLSGGTESERRDMMERLRGNVRFLMDEAVTAPQDEYALMKTTAASLGITVEAEGILPQNEPYKHILATAIHESFTNVLRHTNGDTLRVTITKEQENGRLRAVFTDNGTIPVKTTAERGGLRSLRALIERSDGTMEITAHPRYTLTITLPKEHHENEV